MREIKFRAWHEEGRKMCNDIEIFDGPMDGAQDDIKWHIMQYTGLKDKNGKDVYEGDILTTGAIVEWSNKNARFFIKMAMLKDTEVPLGVLEFEIIGNIYENSELLK